MKGCKCLICERINMIKEGRNPYFVRELETGYVVIGDHQHFKGYTLFLYKHHGEYTELFQLPPQERARFLEEMTVAKMKIIFAILYVLKKPNVQI